MARTIIGFLTALILAGVMTACRSVGNGKPMLPPELPTGAAGLSAFEINKARDLYVAKCAKCHRFYEPSDYSLEEWDSWMDKMSRKSRLNVDQEEQLSRYLGAFRRAEASGQSGVSED